MRFESVDWNCCPDHERSSPTGECKVRGDSSRLIRQPQHPSHEQAARRRIERLEPAALKPLMQLGRNRSLPTSEFPQRRSRVSERQLEWAVGPPTLVFGSLDICREVGWWRAHFAEATVDVNNFCRDSAGQVTQ